MATSTTRVPALAARMEENLPAGLSFFALPKTHRRYLRTNNRLENRNGKIKQRTAVVGMFPSTVSVLRLVSAVLRETDERWLSGRKYLNMNTQPNG